MAKKCSICSDDKKMDWVARRHIEGFTPNKMEGMSKEQGLPMKRETISRHLRNCIGTSATGDDVVRVAAAVGPVTTAPAPEAPEDVAVLVQRQVVEKLKEGEARVTVQHGLQAQQLLDRRAERAKDRELAVTLARLLHAPPPPPEAITHRRVAAEGSDEIIEGEAVEIAS